MSALINILKRIGLLAAILLALRALGYVVDTLVPWQYLTDFFSLLKVVIAPFDFLIDTTTLFLILSLVLLFYVAFWVYKATLWVIHFFH